MSDAAAKSKAGAKRKTLAEKIADESAKIIGDLKASSGRQTRNGAKGIVYQPPVKKARAPKDPNAPKGNRGRPAKGKDAPAKGKGKGKAAKEAVAAPEAATNGDVEAKADE